jgi:hypothetical protein
MNNQGKYLKMMTTNTKDIKLWKLHDREEKKVAKSAGKELQMPKLQSVGGGLNSSLQYFLFLPF